MTLLVRRIDGKTIQLVNGLARLRAILSVNGKATVLDIETQESFEVHEVDGQLVALEDGSGAAVEKLATEAIRRAARPSDDL